MNAQRKVIKHFKHDYNDSTSLCNNNVWKIFEDKDNVLWFATNGGGLDKLNPDGKSFTHYRHNDADSRSIACNDIQNIFEDKKVIFGSAVVIEELTALTNKRKYLLISGIAIPATALVTTIPTLYLKIPMEIIGSAQ